MSCGEADGLPPSMAGQTQRLSELLLALEGFSVCENPFMWWREL